MVASQPLIILPQAEWESRAQAHAARVEPWLAPHVGRFSRGEAHPVYDFLFTYYSFTPGQLRRWHPGFGVALSGPDSECFLAWKGYARAPDGVTASAAAISPARATSLRWLLGFLEAVAERTPQFACHGMHEWAMVYRSAEVRHSRWPLRMSPPEIARLVESQALCCTHYDAFRFFTPEARPMNRYTLDRTTTAGMDQRGCLHANMDLYKWAYKITPFCPSELVADCFALALAIREVDMRASPYDFSSIGFRPICVETPEGRAEYEEIQRDFSRRGEPLRQRLMSIVSRVVHSL